MDFIGTVETGPFQYAERLRLLVVAAETGLVHLAPLLCGQRAIAERHPTPQVEPSHPALFLQSGQGLEVRLPRRPRIEMLTHDLVVREEVGPFPVVPFPDVYRGIRVGLEPSELLRREDRCRGRGLERDQQRQGRAVRQSEAVHPQGQRHLRRWKPFRRNAHTARIRSRLLRFRASHPQIEALRIIARHIHVFHEAEKRIRPPAKRLYRIAGSAVADVSHDLRLHIRRCEDATIRRFQVRDRDPHATESRGIVRHDHQLERLPFVPGQPQRKRIRRTCDEVVTRQYLLGGQRLTKTEPRKRRSGLPALLPETAYRCIVPACAMRLFDLLLKFGDALAVTGHEFLRKQLTRRHGRRLARTKQADAVETKVKAFWHRRGVDEHPRDVGRLISLGPLQRHRPSRVAMHRERESPVKAILPLVIRPDRPHIDPIAAWSIVEQVEHKPVIAAPVRDRRRHLETDAGLVGHALAPDRLAHVERP